LLMYYLKSVKTAYLSKQSSFTQISSEFLFQLMYLFSFRYFNSRGIFPSPPENSGHI
jgi:hypothetical protein